LKVQDVRELKQALKDLPAELTPENKEQFAKFGLICRDKYVPELLRTAGLQNETPEFEKDPCAFCFWKYQEVKLGCVACVDKSEYVDYCSVEASEKKKQLVQLLRDEA